MNNKDKLKLYIEVSEKIKRLAKLSLNNISTQLNSRNKNLHWREKAIFGLTRKIYLTFECLVEDSIKERGEAQHHLKTIVECFLYYHWVVQDESDTNAKLLIAKGCKGKISFFNKNPEYPENAEFRNQWEDTFNKLIHGIEIKWREFKNKSLEKIAEDSRVDDYYRRIYKLSCEPAHISDIMDYLPIPSLPLTLDQPITSKLWSTVAIDYALNILCYLVQDASDFYQLGLNVEISNIKFELTKIRNNSI